MDNKLLIVDDSREIHLILKKLVSKLNINVYSAYNGEECIELCKRHSFFVIFMDVQMPRMDGFEASKLLRQIPRYRVTPIVFITASDGDKHSEIQAYEAGGIDHIIKPINRHVVMGKVNIFLQIHQQKTLLREELLRNQRLKERTALLLKAVGEGVLGLNRDGIITFANPVALNILKRNQEPLVGDSILKYFIFDDNGGFVENWVDCPIEQHCAQGECWRQDIGVYWRKNDKLYPAEYIATPIIEEGIYKGVVIVFQDITKRRDMEKKLIELAHKDGLTGLCNRYITLEMLTETISHSKRENSKLAVLYMDLDRFKGINDSLGHSTGDELLIATAGRLSACVKETDIVCRMGGDEFVIILKDIDTQENAASVAKRIIESIKQPFILNESECLIGISIGISTFPNNAETTDELLKKADTALYESKNKGRSCYHFYQVEQ
ncbi:hypothetical protein NBRC116188_20370 [Oceaniserpentilla sp. 4NH20-0058]|uniref:GGDEF domain-containing response regulator n=1 Tax=Oceaniserpentilla sp. 4NH20-0058 TaxID=3127660 RepID=UPI0031023838